MAITGDDARFFFENDDGEEVELTEWVDNLIFHDEDGELSFEGEYEFFVEQQKMTARDETLLMRMFADLVRTHEIEKTLQRTKDGRITTFGKN